MTRILHTPAEYVERSTVLDIVRRLGDREEPLDLLYMAAEIIEEDPRSSVHVVAGTRALRRVITHYRCQVLQGIDTWYDYKPLNDRDYLIDPDEEEGCYPRILPSPLENAYSKVVELVSTIFTALESLCLAQNLRKAPKGVYNRRPCSWPVIRLKNDNQCAIEFVEAWNHELQILFHGRCPSPESDGYFCPVDYLEPPPNVNAPFWERNKTSFRSRVVIDSPSVKPSRTIYSSIS